MSPRMAARRARAPASRGSGCPQPLRRVLPQAACRPQVGAEGAAVPALGTPRAAVAGRSALATSVSPSLSFPEPQVDTSPGGHSEPVCRLETAVTCPSAGLGAGPRVDVTPGDPACTHVSPSLERGWG
ncbi:unnamed protein product [Rangifer tarandus platyrhynchus]|uniref:Uncharacterized protein n=2 Tax=Rangifer tarandus platyrhynchus TaxID=3082113 RepID=A0ABN8ZCJ5_RANTA|nr:unnamed protein product [Rangifer tarandus platyrhynchus]CAI9706026.1 unnamed protein product [Rangifer tarandus platyrhynchus]